MSSDREDSNSCEDIRDAPGIFDNIISNIVEPLSATTESDFDEFLDVPESVTVEVINGENIVTTEKQDEVPQEDIIPFCTIHNPPLKFKAIQRKVFIPGVDIKVTIIDHERSVTAHLLNPNLYTIRFEHGDYSWVVNKRYKHIHHLHRELRLFRASLNIPIPTKSHKEKRASFKMSSENDKGKKKSALPRFPNRPEAFIPYEHIGERIKQLEEYLNNILKINIYRNHHETIHFMQVSNLSFVNGLGGKGKEGEILKRTGSTLPGQSGCNFCGLVENGICVRCNYFWSDIMCGSWQKRWFFVKDTFFGYVSPKDGIIRGVILFDQGFEVSSGMYSTGLHNGLQILTNCRQLVIKCWTKRKSKDWMQYLKDTAHHKASDFILPNPHSSFVPMRPSTKAAWFVDGADYMKAVAYALEAAREEIYIADWWLSPEIYMRRPAVEGDYWRLDVILKRKANDGVKVFVLLYKEVELALGINSYYSKQRLIDGSSNIKVLRHPDHAKKGVYFWAHHEKIVVVDQSYAFVGGIDLCYGRWDNFEHRLTDHGGISIKRKDRAADLQPSDSCESETMQYIDNAKQASIDTVDDAEMKQMTCQDNRQNIEDELFSFSTPDNIKCNTPEMERKNRLGKFKDNVKSKTKDFLNKLSNHPTEEDKKNAALTEEAVEPQKPRVSSDQELINGLSGSAKFWIGKDYVNFILKDFSNLELPFLDFIDRLKTPRMPWHDIGAMVRGPAARDVARHFIQRWNSTKLEKARECNSYPYLMPKSYDCSDHELDLGNVTEHNVTCQVLRSVSNWSVGFLDCDQVEQSIHDAYIKAINQSQHYIYIENQFFITLAMGSINVRNQIGEALFKRIKKAHREKQIFRVYVVMPLLPGFEGEVGGEKGTAIHAITHWNYASISRGKESLIGRLTEAGITDPSDYISFYGLRNHSVLNDEPITELIYVHSKLMIVDDSTMICGSANINDRSMLGKRDSEIAVLIKDEEFIPGIMNGQSTPSGKYCGSLRKYLFKEHLGILKRNKPNIDVSDPISDKFYKETWMRIAEINTETYTDVFNCIPSDKVLNFESLKENNAKPHLYVAEPHIANKLLSEIQGHLVKIPLKFLQDEILTPAGGTVEGMMPTSLWI